MHNVLRESLDPEDRGGSRQRRVDKHNTQVLTIRSQWQLKLLHKLKDKCEGWRHAAGLKAKELVWEDARVRAQSVWALECSHASRRRTRARLCSSG